MTRSCTLLTVSALAVGCVASGQPDILASKERHEVELMGLPGVIGVGIGDCDGRPCIKVYTEVPTLEVAPSVPETLDGHPVDLEFIGTVRALDTVAESMPRDVHQAQTHHTGPTALGAGSA